MKKEKHIYVGELGKYRVYKTPVQEIYYAVDSETQKFIMSGASYEEVFDELAYVILEDEAKHSG